MEHIACCLMLLLASDSVGPVAATRPRLSHKTIALLSHTGQNAYVHEEHWSRSASSGGCRDFEYVAGNGVNAEACLNANVWGGGCVLVMFPKSEPNKLKTIAAKSSKLQACCERKYKYEDFENNNLAVQPMSQCFQLFHRMGISDKRIACSVNASGLVATETFPRENSDACTDWAIPLINGDLVRELRGADDILQELTGFKKRIYDAYRAHEDTGKIPVAYYSTREEVSEEDMQIIRFDGQRQEDVHPEGAHVHEKPVSACLMIVDVQQLENALYAGTRYVPSNRPIGKFMKGELAVIQTFGSRAVVAGAATAGLDILTLGASMLAVAYPVMRGTVKVLEQQRQLQERLNNFLTQKVFPWCDQLLCLRHPNWKMSVKYMNYVTGTEKAQMTCNVCGEEEEERRYTRLPVQLRKAADHLLTVCDAVAPLKGTTETGTFQRVGHLDGWNAVAEHFSSSARAFHEALTDTLPDKVKAAESSAELSAREAAYFGAANYGQFRLAPGVYGVGTKALMLEKFRITEDDLQTLRVQGSQIGLLRYNIGEDETLSWFPPGLEIELNVKDNVYSVFPSGEEVTGRLLRHLSARELEYFSAVNYGQFRLAPGVYGVGTEADLLKKFRIAEDDLQKLRDQGSQIGLLRYNIGEDEALSWFPPGLEIELNVKDNVYSVFSSGEEVTGRFLRRPPA